MAAIMTTVDSVLHIPNILEIIFKNLDHRDRKRSRLISYTFDLVSTKYLTFQPILTELTRTSILQMESDLKIEIIRAVQLYKDLPVQDRNTLDCRFNMSGVKSLSFYEGVSKFNKSILILSFPRLEQLRYVSTTNFAFPEEANLRCLKKLEIRSPVFDETGSLQSVFRVGRFPVLEVVELHLCPRLDFLLYLEVHHFLAVHLKHLKILKLFFRWNFLFVTSEISKIFIHFPPVLNERHAHVESIFRGNQTSLRCCRLKYLPCEGVGKYNLTTILHENLQRLNPATVIRVFESEEELTNSTFGHMTGDEEYNEEQDAGGEYDVLPFLRLSSPNIAMEHEQQGEGATVSIEEIEMLENETNMQNNTEDELELEIFHVHNDMPHNSE